MLKALKNNQKSTTKNHVQFYCIFF